MCLLFRRSLDEGIFPDLWKLCSVTPVFKSGNISQVTNYRLISILSHISKLFESVIFNNINSIVNPIIMEEQHRFRPGRSTTTCNAVLCNHIFKAFNVRSQVDVVYTVFVKSFYRVDHQDLLTVLRETSFGKPLLSWLCSFIEGRKQWVKIHGITSNILPVTSGVPQGVICLLCLFLCLLIVLM